MNGSKFLRIRPAFSLLAGSIAFLGMTGCVVTPDGRMVFELPVVSITVEPIAQPGAAPVPEPAVATVQASSDDQLQQLVAPIALYPDPLLADIMPASTFPDQIEAAAQWVQDNPAPADEMIAQQPWDPSVQALVHYPTVLAYMAGEIEWTKSLGSAVTNEQPDVMAAIQDLRAQAVNQGNLANTPEQVIVNDDAIISIQPVDPAVIFVPTYDPVLVYQGPVAITFGPRFVAGAWLVHGFDWRDHYLFHGDWRGGWVHGPYGWHADPHWVRPGAWTRDDRWGRPPFVAPERYHYRPELVGHERHAVETIHRQEIGAQRPHGELPGHSRPPVVPGNRPSVRPGQLPQHHPGAVKTQDKDKKKNES